MNAQTLWWLPGLHPYTEHVAPTFGRSVVVFYLTECWMFAIGFDKFGTVLTVSLSFIWIYRPQSPPQIPHHLSDTTIPLGLLMNSTLLDFMTYGPWTISLVGHTLLLHFCHEGTYCLTSVFNRQQSSTVPNYTIN
jgi:hypothetical protein